MRTSEQYLVVEFTFNLNQRFSGVETAFPKAFHLRALYTEYAYHIFVIENRDASKQRALSEKCGS